MVRSRSVQSVLESIYPKPTSGIHLTDSLSNDVYDVVYTYIIGTYLPCTCLRQGSKGSIKLALFQFYLYFHGSLMFIKSCSTEDLHD